MNQQTTPAPGMISATFEYTELHEASQNPNVRESTRNLLKPPPSPFESHSRIAVWYAKNLRDAAEQPVLLTHENRGTHTLLGAVEWRRDWQSLYGALQGEFWSPRGEARRLIKMLGLHHTSMSVGDVLVCYNPDETVEVWMCANTGWRQLDTQKTLYS